MCKISLFEKVFLILIQAIEKKPNVKVEEKEKNMLFNW